MESLGWTYHSNPLSPSVVYRWQHEPPQELLLLWSHHTTDWAPDMRNKSTAFIPLAEKTQNYHGKPNLIINLPWGQVVLLWPPLRGRWLPQSEPGSHRSWPPVGSSGASEPMQAALNAWVQKTQIHLPTPYGEIYWQDSPVPSPAFPFW